jgi:lauroyl/myristoyl acyltransferase
MEDPPTNSRPIELQHYLVYGVYRVFEFILKLFPMKLVCLTGVGVGHLSYLIFRDRKQTVIRNLRIAFGEEMSREEIKRLARKTFHQSGSNLIASIRTSSFSEAQLRKRLEVVGAENLTQAKAQGTGVICLLSHMGNWELLAQLHLILPGLVPPATLYRPLDNPLIDSLIKRRRGSDGTQLFSRRDGFFKPIAHIKEGGSLGVLGDQHAGKQGMAVPLFEKLTSLTNLPAILHRRTGACILPISMASTTLGKWCITVHPAIAIPADKKTDTQHITSLCAGAYETMMRSSPADVFWMHGYWKTGRRGPLKIDGLQKKKARSQEAAASQAFKVVVFTGDATSESTEIIQCIDKLKNYRSDIHLTTAGKRRIYPNGDHFMHLEPEVQDTLIISHLIDYDHSLPAPIDCVLDISADNSGARLFKEAGFTHVFAPQGEFQGTRTEKHFATIKEPTLSDFLISLGIED